jgi:tetratricopeptide (TPR) repeat protein
LPLNTDDFPYVEFQAPRGNVAPREKVVRDALDLYAVLSDGGREVTPPVAGWPPLTGSGSERAAAYLELAARYTTAAMWSRALRTLDAAVALDPASAQAHAQLGELLITRGRVAEAEPRLQKALALDPDLERPYELLGTLYLDRGDTAKAENLDRELIRRRPSAAPAYLRLASIVARRAEWAEARDLLRKAREIDPNLAIDARLVQFLEQKARPPASNPAVRR